MGETGSQPIDQEHHFIAVRHGEVAARAEIVLHVDDQERITRADDELVGH
jgi:hypothetical protein